MRAEILDRVRANDATLRRSPRAYRSIEVLRVRGRMVRGAARAVDADAKKSWCSICSSATACWSTPDSSSTFPHEVFLVVSLLPEPAAFRGGYPPRAWSGPMPDAPSRFDSGRHAGVLVPLFSIPSRVSWGIGEIPDLRALRSLARRRRARLRAAAAGQRDGRRAELAVLGAERDGDRSDLHRG